MARYIDKDFVIEHLKFLKEENVELTYDMLINEFIEILPTEDVAPIVQGEWIMCGNDDLSGFSNTFQCSQCKETIQLSYQTRDCNYRFCPNCGAKMEESE